MLSIMIVIMDPVNESIFFPQFNDLPSEMKEHIIRQRPELISAFFLVNRELHQLSARLYLEEALITDLSHREILTYQEMKPLMVGNIKVQERTTTYAEKKVDRHIYIRLSDGISANKYGHIHTCIQFDNNLSGSTTQCVNHVESVEINRLYNYDYMTHYQILKKRLGCIRISPSYARDHILSDLDDWYQDTDANMMIFYQFLYMNAFIFNIPQSPNEIFIMRGTTYTITDLREMLKVEIPRLYKEIRTAILKLD